MTAGDMKYHEGDVTVDEVEKIVESAYEVPITYPVMKTEPFKLGSSVRRRSLGDLLSPNH